MPVEYEKRGPIGIVTLSRPGARNAWGADFNEGLARARTVARALPGRMSVGHNAI